VKARKTAAKKAPTKGGRKKAAAKRRRSRFDEEAFNTMARALPQKVMLRVFETSRRVILDWQDAGMPRAKDKSYDLYSAVPWMRKRLARSVDSDDGGGSAELERGRGLRANMLELDLREREGELLDAAEVKSQWGRLLTTFRQTLLGIPSRLAPALAATDDPVETSRLLEEQIAGALAALAAAYEGEGE